MILYYARNMAKYHSKYEGTLALLHEALMAPNASINSLLAKLLSRVRMLEGGSGGERLRACERIAIEQGAEEMEGAETPEGDGVMALGPEEEKAAEEEGTMNPGGRAGGGERMCEFEYELEMDRDTDGEGEEEWSSLEYLGGDYNGLEYYSQSTEGGASSTSGLGH